MQLRAEGVELLGVVEGDAGNPGLRIVQDVLVSYVALLGYIMV